MLHQIRIKICNLYDNLNLKRSCDPIRYNNLLLLTEVMQVFYKNKTKKEFLHLVNIKCVII